MPRVNVSQPLVRQALFLIGTNRMFLLTNKRGAFGDAILMFSAPNVLFQDEIVLLLKIPPS